LPVAIRGLVIAGTIPGAAIAIVRGIVAVPLPLAFVAVSVSVDVPTELVVPEISPVAALKFMPEGRFVTR